MGKTNISQGPEQIKGILFPKTTKSGATALQTPEKSHTGSQFFCLLKVRGCSIRSAKAGTHCLFKWEALQSNRRRRRLQTRVPAWASVHRPSETCFPFACSKVCIHSHEAPTIRQQHDTINQNQTSKRVFVGTSQLCNVPPTAKRLKSLALALWGWEGEGGNKSVCSQKMLTKWHITDQMIFHK